MKRKLTCALALAVLAGGAVAHAQPDQLAHDQAVKAQIVAAHEHAVRSGDKAEIAKTEAQGRAIDEDIFNDKKDAALKIPEQDRGALRDSDAELIRAKEAHQRALASGEQARIAITQAALRKAYERHWALTHEKNAGR